MRVFAQTRAVRAFTLIELLLVITIVLLLISLLLPALNRGRHKVKEIQCTSNLHQAGLGFLSFAHGHEDKFPVQVSTNSGGSAEFVDAGNTVHRNFFFSYKHFLPLASEIETPKILVCPTDLRLPATNFSGLNNSNLSYFTAANPVFGNSDSPLTGDRNLEPVSNTVARVGPRKPLRWTGEMHQYKGNVLFADGHVSQLADLFSQSNRPSAPLTSLIMPDVPGPSPADSGAGMGANGGGGGATPNISGGSLRASFPAKNPDFVLTNGGTLTNFQITSGPRNTPRSAFVIPGPVGAATPLPDSATPVAEPPNGTGSTSQVPASVAASEPGAEQQLQEAHEELVQKGRNLARKGFLYTYGVPWWLIVVFLFVALWLLKRTHDRRVQRQPPKTTAPDFFFSKER